MQCMVLEGGMKGWVKAGAQFTRLMDGFKEDYWEKLLADEGGRSDAKDVQSLFP
jgi:arsenical-resistance protein 2